MQKLGFVFLGVAIAGLVFSACVGDATPVGGQGQLDGPCYVGNTCNAGLKCDLSSGAGKCIVAPVSDAGVIDTGTPDVGPDSSGVCIFTPTSYPCKDIQQPITCFGLSQGCTVTGCGSDVMWMCNSPNQCAGTPCCVPAEAVLKASVNCTQGTLQLASPDAGGVQGAICRQGNACPAGETQLCQSNAQCPKDQVCGPVKVTGGPGSMNNYTVGACGPK